MSEILEKARRVVIKVGSALLVDAPSGELKRDWLATLAADVAALKGRGKEVLVVSSGAIALGRRALGLIGAGEIRLEESQAAAAVGQVRLAQAYVEAFLAHGLTAAQILLTLEDTEARRRYLNARATLTTLIVAGAVPVINENDTIATAEICFGDNDRLAARVAVMMAADLLILLSDVDGLYSADPVRRSDAVHIPEVTAITSGIEAYAQGSSNGMGKGGMRSKLAAAKIAIAGGTHVILASGRVAHPIAALSGGRHRQTLFHARTTATASRKRWIGAGLAVQGTLIIDAGAERALASGKSLLPVGVKQVQGDFERGDTVLIMGEGGFELARGLVAHQSADARRIAGKRTAEVEATLGFRGRGEMVHRDDLVWAGPTGKQP